MLQIGHEDRAFILGRIGTKNRATYHVNFLLNKIVPNNFLLADICASDQHHISKATQPSNVPYRECNIT